jgi:hypothetical protein
MVKFEDALDVRALDDGRNWLVLEDFYYDTDIVLTPQRGESDRRWPNGVQCWARGWRVIVPKGFVTDFASIPRPLWALVGGPADGRYRKIAVIHDYLYRTKGLATRKQADDVLLEGMKFSGCSWWQRTIIYSGVRVGGSSSYKGGL